MLHLFSAAMFRVVRSLFGLTPDLSDARPAHLSVALGRVAIFSAMLWIHFILVGALLDGNIEQFVEQRRTGAYFPAGLLLLFGSAPPSAVFFEAARWASLVASVMAIVGFVTRPAMIVSTVATLLLALLDLSRYQFWSHPYHVVFLSAIPFMLVQAGSAMSVDRWLHQKFGWVFGRRTEPVLWGVLAAQYAVALFYFGAFWAKMMVSRWGLDYVFSDNLRNILALTWSNYNEYAIPAYVQWIASVPALWMFASAVHLAMQALPIAVVFCVNRPWLRLIEGLNYAAGAIGLRVVMTVWNPWWLLLVTLFVDWDHFAGRLRRQAGAAAAAWSVPRRAAVTVCLTAFFGVFLVAFLSQRSNSWRLYPFDQLNMYAAVYATPPIRDHVPFAHVLRGNITVQWPRGSAFPADPCTRWIRIDTMPQSEREALLPTFSRKRTVNEPILYRVEGDRLRFSSVADTYHLLARLNDLNKLEEGMREFLRFAAPLPAFPEGSALVVRRQDVAFAPYPRPLGERSVLHEGAKGILDLSTSAFHGVSAKFDQASGAIKITTKGQVKIEGVRARPMYPAGVQPVDAKPVPGEWITPTEFRPDRRWLESLSSGYTNIVLDGETPAGSFEFDGPLISK